MDNLSNESKNPELEELKKVLHKIADETLSKLTEEQRRELRFEKRESKHYISEINEILPTFNLEMLQAISIMCKKVVKITDISEKEKCIHRLILIDRMTHV